MKVSELQASATRATALLKAMSNSARLLILCQLVDGEKSVGELGRLVGMRQSALSQHLALLRRNAIVATRREAQSIYYSLDSREAVAVMNTLYKVFCARTSSPHPAPRLREKRA